MLINFYEQLCKAEQDLAYLNVEQVAVVFAHLKNELKQLEWRIGSRQLPMGMGVYVSSPEDMKNFVECFVECMQSVCQQD